MTTQCQAVRSDGSACNAPHGQWVHRADDAPEWWMPCAVDGWVDYCMNRDIREATLLFNWRPQPIRIVVVDGLCQLHRRRVGMVAL